MGFHDFLLIALAALSEAIGTISGFGSSTFFVPAAVLLETFGFVLALTAILHCFGNFSKLALFGKHTPKKLIIRLGLPFVVFTGLGALLSAKIPVIFLTKFLGAVLIYLSLLTLLKKNRPQILPQKSARLLCGLSGFITGLVGTGGALRGIALSTLQLEKNSFVALSAAIDLGGDLLRAGIYFYQGYMDWKQWFYIPLLGIAAVGGSLFGKAILNKINQQQFEKIVAGFILISGLGMLFT